MTDYRKPRLKIFRWNYEKAKKSAQLEARNLEAYNGIPVCKVCGFDPLEEVEMINDYVNQALEIIKILNNLL